MRIAVLAVTMLVSFNAAVAADAPKPRQWTGELPVAPAFLRTQLPSNIAAYARIPNLLGLVTMPKESSLDPALRSEANIANVTRIQQGYAQNVLSLPVFADPGFRFITDSVRSPVEVAAFGMPNPAVLVGATLAVRTTADFNRLFDGLKSVRLAAPLDAQGIGQVVGLPLMAFVKFDPATGRLLMFGAPRLDRLEFEQFLLNLPRDVKDHPMYALERRIDSSGQGLFVWADADQLVPLSQMLSPAIAPGLAKAGLGNMRALAFGFGTANGKGRLSFVIDAGEDAANRPFPLVANSVKATAVGVPDAAVLVSLPSREEFSRLELKLAGASGEASRASWEKAKAGIRGAFGVGIEDVLAAVGPDAIALFDEAGDYTAIHLRNPALFDDLIARIGAKTGSTPDKRVIGGITYYHWALPSVLSLAAKSDSKDKPALAGGIGTVMSRLQNHVYWIREGEYLYLAATPQPLMDRQQKGARTRVDAWLATRQRVDMSSSLVAATASIDKLPRRSYEAYLGVLQAIADISGAKADIWSMPTAAQLGLPPQGVVGASLNLGSPYVSLEFTYENHPGEFLMAGGGFGGVAALGVLAAIAVPAYQDYTIRGQVTEGLNLAAPIKAAVAESYASRRALPRDRAAAGLAPSPDMPAARYVQSVQVARGVITITYGKTAHAQLAGKTLVLKPVANAAGDIEWRCGYAKAPEGAKDLVPDDPQAAPGTSIAPKYLPQMCR